MEVHTGSKSGKQVPSLPQLVSSLSRQLPAEQQRWLEQLLTQPERFGDLEVQVHQTFQEWADQVVAGLLAAAGQRPEWASEVKKK
jgi:hypothetical protein